MFKCAQKKKPPALGRDAHTSQEWLSVRLRHTHLYMAFMMLLSRCEREKRSRVNSKQNTRRKRALYIHIPFPQFTFYFIFLVITNRHSSERHTSAFPPPSLSIPPSSFPRSHTVRALLLAVVTVALSEGGVRGVSAAAPSLPLVPSVVGLVLINGHLV